MHSYEVTYEDGSGEVLEADRLYEDEQRVDFVRFTAGGQERYVSRDKSRVVRIERVG